MPRAVLALLVFVLILVPLRAEPCMTVRGEPDPGEAWVPPTIDSETALLVWDPDKKVQHFVRTVDFDTRAKSIGFIVPVPNTPEIAEADKSLFLTLGFMTHPPEPTAGVVLLGDFTWPWIGFGNNGPGARFSGGGRKYITSFGKVSRDDPEPVHVIATTEVAGFTATTLEATDAAALGTWLKENGFVRPEGFEPWAKVYVDQKWKFVAFKLAPKRDAGRADTMTMGAIRISTPTERPYFPYREPPSEKRRGYDRMTLYLVSPVPLVGKLTNGTSWPARRHYAGTRFVGLALRSALPGVSLPMRGWLGEQSDPTWNRPDEELEFFEQPDLLDVDRGEGRYPTSVLVVRWQPTLLALLFAAGGRALFRRRRALKRA